MEVTVTVVVGFGGAFLGATVALLGALYMDRRRVRRTRVGIVRALVGELMENASLIFMKFGGDALLTEYSSETWRKTNLELAQFLDHDLYNDILRLYVRVPLLEGLFRDLQNGAVSGWQYRRSLQDICVAVVKLLDLPQAAGFRSSALEMAATLREAVNTMEWMIELRKPAAGGDEATSG